MAAGKNIVTVITMNERRRDSICGKSVMAIPI